MIGIALAALLGALIMVWSRNERMQELEREAGQDPLTGLKNRRRFEEDLRAAMARARREGTTGAMLMLDLDHFKQVNDTHGHLAGDQVIEEVADVLRQRSRESDVLARLGGDEFAVVLPRCSAAEAQRRRGSDRRPRSATTCRPRRGSSRSPPASAWRCSATDPRTSIASVVSEADTAMYAAKDGGRDGVRVFDPLALRDEAPGGELARRQLAAQVQHPLRRRQELGPARAAGTRLASSARQAPFRRAQVGEEEQVGAGAGSGDARLGRAAEGAHGDGVERVGDRHPREAEPAAQLAGRDLPREGGRAGESAG